ncbi:hypothetical protein MLD52_09530 [Puniceicoccaceae bacterium K14]|nr:hypothetical protein [Puniceicoccaceae bacterium K14]
MRSVFEQSSFFSPKDAIFTGLRLIDVVARVRQREERSEVGFVPEYKSEMVFRPIVVPVPAFDNAENVESQDINPQFQIPLNGSSSRNLKFLKDFCGFSSNKHAVLSGLSLLSAIFREKEINSKSQFGYVAEYCPNLEFSPIVLPWDMNVPLPPIDI